jgi:hypothetical protein
MAQYETNAKSLLICHSFGKVESVCLSFPVRKHGAWCLHLKGIFFASQPSLQPYLRNKAKHLHLWAAESSTGWWDVGSEEVKLLKRLICGFLPTLALA